MIVRDEAATLERCLVSARPHVDEIVVIDTGSTDNTPEIAGRYADVFRAIEWPDSFAIARNVSMDAATGDYILTLDADEYIEAVSAWDTISRVVASPTLLVAYLPVLNVLSEGITLGDRIVQPRIVRNVPEIRWEARVHNQIEHRVLAYGQTHPEMERLVIDAEIIHTGYDLDLDARRRKHLPRIPLMRAQIEESTGRERAYYEYQLACTLASVGDHDGALEIFRRMNWSDLTAECQFNGRGEAAVLTSDPAEALVHAEAMLKIYGQEPVAMYLTGCCLADAGETRRGLIWMCEAFLQAHAGTYRRVLNLERVAASIASILGLMEPPDFEAVRAIQRRLIPPIDLSNYERIYDGAAAV
jgi:glycosyltransferase involved in cell wall biosynthesis